MPASDDLYPPAQYGAGPLLLAFGIIALLILAAILVFVLTRPRRSITIRGTGLAPSAGASLSQLRADYLSQIAAIEQAAASGEIDARRAHLELSRTVRTFVNEYSGLEAPVLTLDELAARGVHPALLEAIGTYYYPSIFHRGPAIDPATGAAAARTVVTTWH